MQPSSASVIPASALAGLGQRAVAALIDAIVLFVAWVAVTVTLAAAQGQEAVEHRELSPAAALVWYALLLLPPAYYIALETLIGGTLGKRALGLRVVRRDGLPSNVGTAAIRFALFSVDLFPYLVPGLLGFILIATSPSRQRLGDRVAGTLVVRRDVAVPGRVERF